MGVQCKPFFYTKLSLQTGKALASDIHSHDIAICLCAWSMLAINISLAAILAPATTYPSVSTIRPSHSIRPSHCIQHIVL
jgi:hypothetical protein